MDSVRSGMLIHLLRKFYCKCSLNTEGYQMNLLIFGFSKFCLQIILIQLLTEDRAVFEVMLNIKERSADNTS